MTPLIVSDRKHEGQFSLYPTCDPDFDLTKVAFEKLLSAMRDVVIIASMVQMYSGCN